MATTGWLGWIVYDGKIIYGVGATENAARQDARNWAENTSNLCSHPATPELIAAVLDYGGQVAWSVDHTVAKLDSEVAE